MYEQEQRNRYASNSSFGEFTVAAGTYLLDVSLIMTVVGTVRNRIHEVQPKS